MKIPLTFLAGCLVLRNSHAQQRYAYLPEGITTVQTSSTKIIFSRKNLAYSPMLSIFVADSAGANLNSTHDNRADRL
jgi:hypothetical protein